MSGLSNLNFQLTIFLGYRVQIRQTVESYQNFFSKLAMLKNQTKGLWASQLARNC